MGQLLSLPMLAFGIFLVVRGRRRVEAAGLSDFEDRLRRLILDHGPISVARYMTLALAHPTGGYYPRRDPFGAAGDFVTAPEISQLFGELIGLALVQHWLELGRPPRVALVELGPGRGTLMADVLRAARVVPAFRAAATRPSGRDQPGPARAAGGGAARSAGALARRARRSARRPPAAAGRQRVPRRPADPAVRAAVRPLARAPGRCSTTGAFGFVLATRATPFPEAVGEVPAELPDGTLVELAPAREALVEDLALRLSAQGGLALLIDYGGELADDRRHASRPSPAMPRVDPLVAPGQPTCPPMSTSARWRAARSRAGAAVYGPVTQGEFLGRLGIELRLRALRRARDTRAGQGPDRRPRAPDGRRADGRAVQGPGADGTRCTGPAGVRGRGETAMMLRSDVLVRCPGCATASSRRPGGVSEGVWASLNVGLRSGDDPAPGRRQPGPRGGGTGQRRRPAGHRPPGPWRDHAHRDRTLGQRRRTRGRRAGHRPAGPAARRAHRRLRPGAAGRSGGWRDRRRPCRLEGCARRRAGIRRGRHDRPRCHADADHGRPRSLHRPGLLRGRAGVRRTVRRAERGELPHSSTTGPAGHASTSKGSSAHRLRLAGVGAVDILPHDTCAEAERFFSFRRTTLRGEAGFGLQLSGILLAQ